MNSILNPILKAISAAYEGEFFRWSYYRDKASGMYLLIRLTDKGVTQTDVLEHQREHEVLGQLGNIDAIENLLYRMSRDAAATEVLKALAEVELPPRESMNADVFRQFCKNLAESEE
jgi:predicted RNA-binding protein